MNSSKVTSAPVSASLLDLLRCPDCTSTELAQNEGHLRCHSCGRIFPIVDGIPIMMPGTQEAIKDEMIDFWGKGYVYRFDEFERDLTPESLRAMLVNATEESIADGHLVGREIDLSTVAGKRCLEIGCGGGGQGLILGMHGAEIISTDLCFERTAPAARKIQMLGLNGHACEADAEELPFRDESFDIVFSQGVLHHTPKTDQTIAHVHRVLKPGGVAYIGLYARHSFHYYVTEMLYMGILRGALFRYGRDWLSAVTEMAQVRPGGGRNPITKVYSARELRKLFSPFSSVELRKSDFSYTQIPLFERAEAFFHPERYGPRAPRRRSDAIERALSPLIGWSFYIKAVK